VLWGSLNEATTAPRYATFVDNFSLTENECPAPDPSIDGDSFGLPFVLALASRVLGLPFVREFASTGVVDAYGAVTEIDGLLEKAQALRSARPDVRFLLVPAEQNAEDIAATQQSCKGLEIVPVASCSKAYAWAFNPAGLSKALIRRGHEPAEREELVEKFFELTLSLKSDVVSWAPIARAADLALRKWRALDSFHKWQLRVAREVALRHAGNGGDFLLKDGCAGWALTMSPGWLPT
jgi:hypothetical protein